MQNQRLLCGIQNDFEVYWTRWIMLALFSILSFSNAMLWIAYSAISDTFVQHYNIDQTKVNLFSTIYMIIYIPLVLPSSWVVDTLGLRIGLISGAVLNCLGAWVRYIGKNSDGFPIALTGQSIAAVAQTFILAIPPKVAANWFPNTERTLATSIAAIFNQLGIAGGFYMSPGIVKTDSDISLLLFIQALLCSGIFILIVIFFRGTPPTPPSLGAASEKQSFKNGLFSLVREPSFIIIFFSFGIGVGGFYSISTLLNQILIPYNYTNDQIGLYGVLIIVVGVVGAFVTGFIGNKYHKYKLLMLIFYAGVTISFIWFYFAIKPDNNVMMCFVCSFMGFTTTGILPVSLEGAVEVTYPVAEGISAGAVMMAAQIGGIIFISVLGLTGDKIKDYLWILVGASLFSTVIMFFFKENYKRIEAEKEVEKEEKH